MRKEEINEDLALEESPVVEFKIGSYEDIFSDFDPRPSSVRGFSEDFLSEAKRAVISRNSEKISFVITLPKKGRSPEEEIAITHRLKRHFKDRHSILEKEQKKILRKGWFFTITGIVLMIIATYFFFKFQDATLIASFLTILLEPASWFLFWEGLDLVIFESKTSNPSLEFSRRMFNAEILFASA